ncbi:MAG: hypothetical protein NVSMB19_18420 [Vulcanimicrobiaceae bacterium]
MNRPFRPGAKGVEQVLGPLEAAIMERLWALGAQSVGDLHGYFYERSGLAYTTVYSELSRLVKKKLIVKRGAYADATYAARLPRERFVGDLVRSVLKGLLDAHGPIAVHGFVDLVARDDGARAALTQRLEARDTDEA